MEDVSNSHGANRSDGINMSNGINWSGGVNVSNGINESDGVNESEGINWAYGVNRSYGVNWSYGVNRSHGVNRSYGVNRSHGVSRAIFLEGKKSAPTIFGKEVSEERFEEVLNKIKKLTGSWKPTYTNAFKLYNAEGKTWKNVDATKIEATPESEAWLDMPVLALEYIRSLPEFDADIFFAVTGIKPNQKKETIKIGDYEFYKDDVEKRLNGLKPIV